MVTMFLLIIIFLLKDISLARGMQTRVYNGPGTEKVNSVVLPAIKDSLSRLHLDKVHASTISRDEFYTTDWMKDTVLLILPGGRDLPYLRDLKDIVLTNIRHFIEKGGSFLGLCAGAYFSSGYVCFEKGTPLEVVGQRDLKLFAGTARGSVYPGFKYNSTAGSVIAPVNVMNKKLIKCGNVSHAYFNGGCEFIPDPGFTNYKTLATYVDFPGANAIIYTKRGKGRIILSGVHPEIDSKYLVEENYAKQQWRDMMKHAPSQRRLLDETIRLLIVT